MFKKLWKFFDKLEDRVRARLSRYTIIYAFVSAISIVLFWRGVWNTADILVDKGGIWTIIFYEPYTIIWTALLLLITGLFVSLFVGGRIILSGVKREKKISEKTEEDIKNEEIEIHKLNKKINTILKDIKEIKNLSRSKFNGDK